MELPLWLVNAPISFEIEKAEENIHTLESPTDFLNTLIDETGKSRDRIYWSSLYYGNGPLGNSLLQKLQQQLINNNDLKFYSIFDYCRGQRGDNGKSTVGQFIPVLSKHPDRSKLYLFRSPFLKGMRNLTPQRYNEIFSVHHMKLYVFDNNVVLSGANLSDDYFSNRQDRYVIIRNCKILADFCCALIETVGQLSYEVTKNAIKPASAIVTDLNQLRKTGNVLFRLLLKKYTRKFSSVGGDSYIFPFLQSEAFGISDEMRVTKDMLMSTGDDSLVVSTSYFNLTRDYQSLLLNESSVKKVDIHVSSPKSNGFFNGTGPSQYVPHGYTYFASKFYDRVISNKQGERIKLYEYERDGWTFHSKGIWLNDENDLPYSSFIGSTNFSYRSIHRDQEAQFILVTSNNIVRRRLKKEVQVLRKWSFPLNNAVFRRADHAIARWVPLAAKIAHYFF